MRKVQSYIPGTVDSSAEEREQRLASTMADRQAAIEGELTLPGVNGKGNVLAAVTKATFRQADVDVGIPHNLGYTPTVVLPGPPSQNAKVYEGERAHTANYIYLRCDTAATTCLVVAW